MRCQKRCENDLAIKTGNIIKTPLVRSSQEALFVEALALFRDSAIHNDTGILILSAKVTSIGNNFVTKVSTILNRGRGIIKYCSNYFILRLIIYAITSAICCCVSAPWSPHAGIEIDGFGPAGVEPC